MELKTSQARLPRVQDEWELKRLGDVADMASGGTPLSSVPAFYGGDIPWVSIADMTRAGRVLHGTEKTLTPLGLDNSAAQIFPVGTVLYAMYASLGECCMAGVPVATSQAILGIKPGQQIAGEFLYYVLIALKVKVRTLGQQGTQANLNKGIVQDFRIALPSCNEQAAIAEVLSDVDALLDGLTQLIAKKRDLKQAAMQQLLTGQTRLPGFNGEWKVKRLGDLILHCASGATPRRNRPEFFGGSIPWISSGELNYNVISDTIEKITSDAVAETNLAVVPAGTFLMAITGLEAEGTRGACALTGVAATTNQSCMAIYPTKALLTPYLFHYYVFRGNSLALQYCQGTKQQSYTAGLVRQLPIALPPTTDEQVAVATVLADLDAELTALEARREKTVALRQAMMQELLTGKTRLV